MQCKLLKILNEGFSISNFSHVYLDIDDTIADLTLDVGESLGCDILSYPQPTISEMIKQTLRDNPEIFAGLSVKSFSLLALARLPQCKLLTHIDGVNDDIQNRLIEARKYWLLQNNIDPIKMIVVRHRHEKANYSGYKKLLIDDYNVNRDEWKQKGGQAINPDNFTYFPKYKMFLNNDAIRDTNRKAA